MHLANYKQYTDTKYFIRYVCMYLLRRKFSQSLGTSFISSQFLSSDANSRPSAASSHTSVPIKLSEILLKLFKTPDISD